VIIGGGNIGLSIAEGLLKEGTLFKSSQITVTRRHVEALRSLGEAGVVITSNNQEAVRNSDVVIIAVKPKQTKEVLEEVRSVLVPSRHIVVSVVTGVSIAEMQAVVGTDIPLFRAMPNTAIAIQESMTCIAYSHHQHHPAQQQQQQKSPPEVALVLSVFEKLGRAILIDEELMAAATVLGACGIAYALRFIRAASQGGIEIGFDAQTAQLIASQTVKGAASLLQKGGQHPEREIDKVTTPQGCTIAGLNQMEHEGFSSSVIKGVGASFAKIAKIPK